MIEMNENNENIANNGNNNMEEIIEITQKSKENRSKSQISNRKRNSMSEAQSNRNSQSQINQAEKPKPVHPIILKVRTALDAPVTQIIMTTLTVYILFADDIKTLSTDKTADDPFSIIVVILMFIFMVELIISAVVMEDYFLGFYFWLDFVSLISMLLDIHWFFDWVIDSISSGGKQAKTIGAIAKAGKSAKIAARAIRILRILRIIRLVRLSKLYKAKEKMMKMDLKKKKEEAKKQQELKEQQEKERHDKEMEMQQQEGNYQELHEGNEANGPIEPGKSNPESPVKQNGIITYNKTAQPNPNPQVAPKKDLDASHANSVSMSRTEDVAEKAPEESKVGKLLSDRTTKRVIILVLSMMIGIILFNASFYYDKKTGMEYGLKIFHSFNSFNDPNLNLTFSIYIKESIDTDSPVVYAKVGYLQYGQKSDADFLRNSEQNKYSEDCSALLPFDPDNSICEAIFDIRNGNKLSAILSIVKTFFICFVLSFGSYCFSKDTTEMVLEPIEAMIEKVKRISKNPIEALQKNEKDEIQKALMEEEERNNAMCGCNGAPQANQRHKKKEVPLETEVLQSTITKIGALLALSFGDAGSEIIAKNMQKNSSGEVNPMISGKKVCAIYAFCDIRNFTDTTEILQEKVMVFVNEIAEIVHEISSEYGGSANKNIGDAFLLVWKFEEKFTYINKKTKELSVYNCEQVNQLCDMALISIIMILAKIYKSKTLDKYRSNEKLNKKFNGYSVRLGFGVHLGWSIEGAIGSTFKIDASYLSPNANMSNALEEKTKEYNALLILSDKFVECLSEDAQSRLRMIDILQGEEPLGLYTVDIDLALLKIEEEESESQQFFNDDPTKNSAAMRKFAKYQKRMKRKSNIDDALSFPPKREFWKDFEESSEDFAVMRQNYSDEFYDLYNEGFDEFHFGDWGKAKSLFEQVLQIRKDRVTERLVEIMKHHNYIKPRDWKGNTAE